MAAWGPSSPWQAKRVSEEEEVRDELTKAPATCFFLRGGAVGKAGHRVCPAPLSGALTPGLRPGRSSAVWRPWSCPFTHPLQLCRVAPETEPSARLFCISQPVLSPPWEHQPSTQQAASVGFEKLNLSTQNQASP